MSKYFSIATILLVCSCSTSSYFRALNSDEKEAIKKYSKSVNLNDGLQHVLIMTTEGDMVVKLYNETPLHRDNFVSKVKSGFYDSLQFHRVINNFMIQGGDPTSKHPKPGQALGGGSAPGGRIPAEFRTAEGIFHKRGALAAARDNNPEKASSNCQFYIVHRKKWRAGELDSSIVVRNRVIVDEPKIELNDAQKELYTTVGGTPHLDGGYTVFGELEIGFDVLDRIASTETRPVDRPKEEVRMRMFLLNELKK
jgi:peptidyl-prolyl cis-trans isomerase B (cyclophilin B)